MTSISTPAFLAGTIGCFLLLFIGPNIKAQSAQEIQKQMDELKQQISLLKMELATLKAVINTNSNGNLTIENKSARTDVIGTDYTQSVGGNSNITSAVVCVLTNHSATIILYPIIFLPKSLFVPYAGKIQNSSRSFLKYATGFDTKEVVRGDTNHGSG